MQYKNLKNIKAENQRNRQSERLKNDITRRLLNYLERKYEMRYNTALGCTEIRKAGSDEPFVPVDERIRNTIAIKARLDGIDAWDKDIRRYTESGFVKAFNPVDDFLKGRKGDGTERTILRRWQTVFLMTMHGGQSGSTHGFWRWWHNGWGWTSRTVTVWHRCLSPDKAIGSLPSANVCYQSRCSGDITIILL